MKSFSKDNNGIIVNSNFGSRLEVKVFTSNPWFIVNHTLSQLE